MTNTRSLVSLLVGLVASLALVPQDDGEPWGDGQEALSPILDASWLEPLDGGAAVMVDLKLGPVVVAFESGTPARVFHLRSAGLESSVLLQESSRFSSVLPETAEPITMTLSGLHTTRAEMFASLLLGDSREQADALLASGKPLPDVVVTVGPEDGLTWGGVLSSDDVSCSITPAE